MERSLSSRRTATVRRTVAFRWGLPIYMGMSGGHSLVSGSTETTPYAYALSICGNEAYRILKNKTTPKGVVFFVRSLLM